MTRPDARTAAPIDGAPRRGRRPAVIVTGVALLAVLAAVLHLMGVLPPG